VTELDSLQAMLAAEHACVYGYGVAAARLRGDDRTDAVAAMNTHIALRDRLTARITADHATPVAALPAYRLPVEVTDPATARQLVAHLEQGQAGAVWDLIAATPTASHDRSLAIGWLADSAVRAVHWGARQALPGQPA
jgi:hypothetical protein